MTNPIRALGVDIGSTTTKAVLLDELGVVVASSLVCSGIRPDAAIAAVREACCRQAGMEPDQVSHCISTGYGRERAAYRDGQVTEITCHARGVHTLLPEARTVIDIGGQDSKVISLDDGGRVVNFVMNDQCAAGTGRFLEVMARTMEVDIAQVGDLARGAAQPVEISSICTVFAESEVISHIAGGADPADIMAGVHRAIARRIHGFLGTHRAPPFAMTGGLAQNRELVRSIERVVRAPVLVPEQPQLVGALGAAHIALERAVKR